MFVALLQRVVLVGAVVVVLGVIAACGAAAPGPATPRETAGTWRELTSEHFVVWTNTTPNRARTLVRTMENLRQVVIGVSFFKQAVRGKSFVIAFDDLAEVHRYIPLQFIAHAWSGRNALLQPVIVLAASSLEHDRQIVTHELTHVVSFNMIRSQPDWFSEGLAGYFETARLDEGHKTLDLGVPMEGRVRLLLREGGTPIAQLFACDEAACKDDRFYATTWALMTYLLNEHRTELMQYIARLIQTPEDMQSQLWAQIFPTLPPDVLDRTLAAWLRHGSIRINRYNIELRDWPVTERPISEADTFAAKGLLRYLTAPRVGASSSEIARALSLDSANIIASMVDAVATKSVSEDRARALTTAHPDDWRAWFLAWRAARTAEDARLAREKTCTLLDATPAAVPIEACARDQSGAFAEDPRRQVFLSATPQFSACMAKSRPADFVKDVTVDLEIDDAGAVTSAHVSLGSAATNACIEKILGALVFPAHHAGPFHMGTTLRKP